jgi:2-polyprenyl-3-methyl-5-hydroxy-6-metoxy-1,4-benzoquinol methylase
MNNQNQNSHLTAIERTSLSYPARIVLNQNKIIGKVLDYGCGIGKDVEILKNKGFLIVGYDPFYFTTFPTEKFDTILCFECFTPRRTSRSFNECFKSFNSKWESLFCSS